MKFTIPIAKPLIDHNETKAVNKAISSGWITMGRKVEEFEKKICALTKSKYSVAVNNGTSALDSILKALSIGPGDEVIVPSLTYISTSNVVLYNGAKLILCDNDPDTFNVTVKNIEKKITKKTKAIMVVHLTGRVCEMDKIIKISKKYNIPIVEDAAQSIGSKFKNKFAGTFGEIGCFSAHPLKNLNAIGDSGYLTTNSSKIANYIKDIRNHGMTNRNKVKNFGYVSRMDNLQAAVLNFRLKNLKKIVKKRRENVKTYLKFLNKKKMYLYLLKN